MIFKIGKYGDYCCIKNLHQMMIFNRFNKLRKKPFVLARKWQTSEKHRK